jgi:triacylglycerol esterase/lipase EstA (alpha/beta hydrolase family)
MMNLPNKKSWPGAIGGIRRLVGAIGHAAKVHGSEVALMASFAANAPRHIVGRRLDPARNPVPPAQAQSARLACPVLLVHGFCGTKSSWSLVARSLKAQGLTVDAISYAPVGVSVEQVADRLVAKVHSMLSETGADKVYLVGHSLGGVIIAQALAAGRLNGLVDTVITLGSPFGGSPLAKLLPFMELPRALQKGSQLLRRLASAPAPDGVRWLAFTAALDVIVPGMRSVPAHAKAETITVADVGHLGMLLHRPVVNHIVDALAA